MKTLAKQQKQLMILFGNVLLKKKHGNRNSSSLSWRNRSEPSDLTRVLQHVSRVTIELRTNASHGHCSQIEVFLGVLETELKFIGEMERCDRKENEYQAEENIPQAVWSSIPNRIECGFYVKKPISITFPSSGGEDHKYNCRSTPLSDKIWVQILGISKTKTERINSDGLRRSLWW